MKPTFVFSNLAISVDGKIATASRQFFPIGTLYDRKLMQTLRKRADAVLMGASTLRTFRRACRISDASVQPMNVIVSSALEGISPDWPFFKSTDVTRVLFVSRLPTPARLRKFERTSRLVFLKNKKSPATEIINALAQLGVRRLLVEGGGEVMWDFAKNNLIDEYNVTLVPRILGGSTAPTLVDGKGFLPSQVLNLKLKQSRRIGDELYLTYRKTECRGP